MDYFISVDVPIINVAEFNVSIFSVSFIVFTGIMCNIFFDFHFKQLLIEHTYLM